VYPSLRALLLLPALALFSQPVVGPEVLSDPIPAVFYSATAVAAPAVALARDQTGVAIAWAMPNADAATRIFVARTDSTAHIRAPFGRFRSPTAGKTNAFYPSLAASVTGNGFVFAWTELVTQPPLPLAQAVYCQLDGTLQPSRPAVLVQPSNAAAPAIVRSGRTKSWITVNGLVWEMKGAVLCKGRSTAVLTPAT
jgi:hypothetical protein